ncbi:MAG: hypothetical protein C0507_13720 [Cyanobacteria bacterium PR.3.49]|nr:hypothetical protein [Cyanobacteria bacterium PR.3.49]
MDAPALVLCMVACKNAELLKLLARAAQRFCRLLGKPSALVSVSEKENWRQSKWTGVNPL